MTKLRTTPPITKDIVFPVRAVDDLVRDANGAEALDAGWDPPSSAAACRIARWTAEAMNEKWEREKGNG